MGVPFPYNYGLITSVRLCYLSPFSLTGSERKVAGLSAPTQRPMKSIATLFQCDRRQVPPLQRHQGINRYKFTLSRFFLATRHWALATFFQTGEERDSAAGAANRNNLEFKNQCNLKQTKDIPKTNRNKNATSALLWFRQPDFRGGLVQTRVKD